ncbi:MAG: DUF4340 domain-containing protein, partial [Acidobacteria bacterium]|nr:DUF4340 domain-containing protein [Acidobacteriota bacterium]
MTEWLRTGIFCVLAVAVSTAAVLVDPGRRTSGIFDDQGEPFYPEFADPQAPRTIEVIDYDEATATASPLKVEFKDNKWGIPSHHDYPADAENRLADTAAALMALRKDMVVSERIEDHGRFGVIDPLDDRTASLAGRGKRVTLKDENDRVLADFVIGKPSEGKPGYRYMRVPTRRRIYSVKTDARVSSRFEDWIETDLLKLNAGDIRKITINSYSINERLGRLENSERTVLTRRKDRWMMGRRRLRGKKIDALTEALDNLRIVDVQPKPENLTRDLKTPEGIRLSMESVLSLRRKGFFITPIGQLLSNEGEILVETANGIQYTLRFGEVAPGGTAAPAGSSEK